MADERSSAGVAFNAGPVMNGRVSRVGFSASTRAGFMTGLALNGMSVELFPSAFYLISYLNEAKRRPRIAHLHRSPISSFTILSTLRMAYEE